MKWTITSWSINKCSLIRRVSSNKCASSHRAILCTQIGMEVVLKRIIRSSMALLNSSFSTIILGRCRCQTLGTTSTPSSRTIWRWWATNIRVPISCRSTIITTSISWEVIIYSNKPIRQRWTSLCRVHSITKISRRCRTTMTLEGPIWSSRTNPRLHMPSRRIVLNRPGIRATMNNMQVVKRWAKLFRLNIKIVEREPSIMLHLQLAWSRTRWEYTQENKLRPTSAPPAAVAMDEWRTWAWLAATKDAAAPCNSKGSWHRTATATRTSVSRQTAAAAMQPCTILSNITTITHMPTTLANPNERAGHPKSLIDL